MSKTTAALEAERIKRGKCGKCGRRPLYNKRMCLRCRNEWNAYQRKRWSSRKIRSSIVDGDSSWMR